MIDVEECVQQKTGFNRQPNLQARTGLPAWMNAAAAISWVAFGDAGAWESWEEFTRRRLHRSWREWELPFGVIGLEDEAHALLAAFQARAAGEPWRPCD